jgi:predicted restriction endonuclease
MISSPSARKPWSRDELIVACNLYFTLPFGQMHSRNPQVIALARSLRRTPGSVAMKLVNFASLDPAHQARGVSGLSGVSRSDREIWQEFHSNWPALSEKSEKLLEELGPTETLAPHKERAALPKLVEIPEGPTESVSSVKVRRTQRFFRKVVLAAYNWRCCVTGNPVPDLLIASHILSWSEFPEHRSNPCNGLCLAAHFDRAFEAGLIAFGEDTSLIVSPHLRAYLPNEAIEREILSMEGGLLRIPERFAPDPKFLAYHRGSRFQA